MNLLNPYSRLLFSFSFILILTCHGFAQTTANCTKAYQLNTGNANYAEVAYSIADAGNSEYYIAGTTNMNGATDILITKHRSDGSVVWAKTYGASQKETVRKIGATTDGGLLIVGQTTSFDFSKGEMLLFKIGKDGNLIWSRKFGVGTAYGELGMGIIQTSDGGYALSGIINVQGVVADLALIRLDKNANVIWAKKYDSNQGENGVGILQKGDTLIVSGDVDNNTSSFNAIIGKFNINNGNFYSGKEIIPASRGLFNSYVFKDDVNGYWLSAHMIDGNSYLKMQHAIIRLDNNFNVRKTYKIDIKGTYANEYYTGFVPAADGFYGCASEQKMNASGFFYHIRRDGTVALSKKFTAPNDRCIFSLADINNKLIAAGRDNSYSENSFFITGFGEDGFIDSLCHPDTAKISVSNPAINANDFSWSSSVTINFSNINAPLVVTDYALIGRSLCDACVADTIPKCNGWLQTPVAASAVQIGDLDVYGNRITVEATFNRTATYSGILYAGDLVSKHRDPNDVNYLLRPNTAEITTSNGYFRTPDICEIDLNKTYHVAMVYDGSILKFYRNGYLMSEVEATGTLKTNNWFTTIGDNAYHPGYNNESFIGFIDEVRIWKTVRTQAQIKQYMNQSLPGPSSQSGLVAYYTFEDLKNKQGNTVWDSKFVGNAKSPSANTSCDFIIDSCGIIVQPTVVTASFTAPDTVCVNTPLTIKNASSGASAYYWNFNVADINQTPEGFNLGNVGD